MRTQLKSAALVRLDELTFAGREERQGRARDNSQYVKIALLLRSRIDEPSTSARVTSSCDLVTLTAA
jgi:hypothetical protein